MSQAEALSEPQLKKLKLVISDLHLGKGRFLPEGGINQFEEFYFDEKLIEFLQYYNSKAFAEYEIELIINGDFLNFLQVDYRGHFLTVLTEGVCIEILNSIIQGHRKLFNALGEFGRTPNRSITYVVGNHDQPMLWAGCQDLLVKAIGAPIKFKPTVYYFDGVHIEHGHMHEAANRMDTRRFFLKKGLPEPILNLPFGSIFFVEFVLRIKERYPFVDKIRPFSRMIRWALFNETLMTLKSFFGLLIYFVKSIFVKNPRKQLSLRRLMKIVFESAIFPDLSQAAKAILNDDRVHTVIFGHSHVYNYRQWKKDKEYFNTGTWTEVTSLDVVSLGKITKLTYVFLEYTGDRPRGRLKEWRGFHRVEEEVVLS
jgi:UDP-2,3-diacylglucosamine pyrophosphatase LpxH